RLLGFRRLVAIAQAEFSAELDSWRTLYLLQGLLSSWLPGVDADSVNALTLTEAARLLEAAQQRFPEGRLVDQTPATCAKCGRQLSLEDRSWHDAWCGDCRSLEGTVNELDIAFRSESRSYDEYGRDP